MLGWTEITTDPESDQYLSDPFTTDGDSAALLALGARADGAIRESYSFLDADLVIRGMSLPVDGYRHTGWLTFA
jgi:hypothetical protein